MESSTLSSEVLSCWFPCVEVEESLSLAMLLLQEIVVISNKLQNSENNFACLNFLCEFCVVGVLFGTVTVLIIKLVNIFAVLVSNYY